ncbi:hypothetical protein GS575_08320, partial [Rhodococcus hoagii]|nr:hypothetical protein [Prescottella equi]
GVGDHHDAEDLGSVGRATRRVLRSNSEWARCTLCIVVRHTITTSGESASAKSPM